MPAIRHQVAAPPLMFAVKIAPVASNDIFNMLLLIDIN